MAVRNNVPLSALLGLASYICAITTQSHWAYQTHWHWTSDYSKWYTYQVQPKPESIKTTERVDMNLFSTGATYEYLIHGQNYLVHK